MPPSISHIKTVTVADWSGTVTVYNSTGGTVTNAGSNLARPSDWNSIHTVVDQTVGYFEPFIPENTNSTLSVPGVGTWYFDPVYLPLALGSGQINCLMADAAGFLQGVVYSAATTGSRTHHQTLYNNLALYRLATGAGTSRLETVWTGRYSILASWSQGFSSNGATNSCSLFNALTLSFPAQHDGSGGVTYSTTSTGASTFTGASTMASTFGNNILTNVVAFVSGSKMGQIPFATSIPAGQYWMAHMLSSSSSSAGTAGGLGSTVTMFSTQSRVHMLEFVGQAYKRLGVSVSNTSSCYQGFHGSLATTTSGATSIVGTSDIRNLLTNHRLYWNYAQSTY